MVARGGQAYVVLTRAVPREAVNVAIPKARWKLERLYDPQLWTWRPVVEAEKSSKYLFPRYRAWNIGMTELFMFPVILVPIVLSFPFHPLFKHPPFVFPVLAISWSFSLFFFWKKSSGFSKSSLCRPLSPSYLIVTHVMRSAPSSSRG